MRKYYKLFTSLLAALIVALPVAAQNIYPGQDIYPSPIPANPTIPGNQGMVVPHGTTAQRPASPLDATIRINETTHLFEFYTNGTWTSAGGTGPTQPVTVDNETGTISGSRQLVNGTNTTVDTSTSGQIKINASGGASILQTVHITLSSAQILALNTSPVQIVAAPGAGKFIIPVHAVARLNFGTVAYVSGGNLNLAYGAGGVNQNIYAIVSTIANYTSAANIWGYYTDMNNGGNYTTGAQSNLDNSPLFIAAHSSNPTSGDGTLDIWLTYWVAGP